jgi:hypothetical protein
LAIVTNVGTGCGGRGSVGRARGCRAVIPVSDRTARRRTALKRLGRNFFRQHAGRLRRMARGSCGRQNRVVLAPVAGVKLMEIVGSNRASINRQSVSDGGKRNSSPGRARHKPLKPSRRESRVIRRTCGPPCAFLRTTAGVMGTRLSLRPLLSRGHRRTYNFGRAAPRDRNVVSSRRPHLSNTTIRAGSTEIALPTRPLFATRWRFSQAVRTDAPRRENLENRGAGIIGGAGPRYTGRSRETRRAGHRQLRLSERDPARRAKPEADEPRRASRKAAVVVAAVAISMAHGLPFPWARLAAARPSDLSSPAAGSRGNGVPVRSAQMAPRGDTDPPGA